MFRYLITITFITSSLISWTIDKRVEKSDSLLLTSHYEVPYLMGYSLIATSIIEGNSETRFGKTTMKALDSFIWSNLATELLKQSFQRRRPRATDNPNEWFYSDNSGGENSFPSGHVASVTASVTPYIFEYSEDYPLVHLLWFFPVQQMAGRVNAQAHWQTDVLAGFLLGTAIGYFSHKRETPLILYFDGDGVYTGLRYRF